MLRKLNNDIEKHINEAKTQGDLNFINKLLSAKIKDVDNMVVINNLLDDSEDEAEQESQEKIAIYKNIISGEEHE